MSSARENWASKIGVVMAVAGSAVGLGNFLRFPVKAATYGGGAFLIPYFIAFILLGIPLSWAEWTLGRYGGSYSHGSAPGILNAVVRKPYAKYLGSLGIFGPLLIFFYYAYIESWLLAFCWYASNGDLMKAVKADTVSLFFNNFITLKTTIAGTFPAALFFFIITFFLNFLIVYYGIRSGIEKISKVAMPTIVILGIVLLIRVLTFDNIESGLSFMWNPDFSQLLKPKVWIEASGQVFFTLSIGIGAILTYASYVRKDQDIALSSLSASAANEFMEVIIGGTIIIPTAVVIYGATNIEEIAKMGTLGLGFNTMPIIFGRIPLGNLFQFTWFFLLFIAGITSSISVLQPAISFFEDEISLSKKQAVLITAVISFIFGLIAVFGLTGGAIDEMDFWGGTFCLVLFGTIETIIFSWIFGIDQAWQELNRGAEIKIPPIFKFVLKYITPTYLIIILAAWFISDGWGFITLQNINPDEMVTFLHFKMSKITFIAAIRILLLFFLGTLNLIIYLTWKLKKIDEKLEKNL